MDHWNGNPGLVRFRTLRQPISKYWTRRFASRTSLSAASFAIPTRPEGGESPHSTFRYSPFVRQLSSPALARQMHRPKPGGAALLNFFLHYGVWGLFILTVADDSFLFLPIGCDLLTVLLVARNHADFVPCIIAGSVGSA